MKRKTKAYRTSDQKLFEDAEEALKWQEQLNMMDRVERFVERRFPEFNYTAQRSIITAINNHADELQSILGQRFPKEVK